MKLYFATRQSARQFAKKANKQSPTKKDANNKWGVKVNN